MSKLSVDQIVLKRLRKYIYGCRIMRGKTSGHLKEHWTRKLAHYRKQMAIKLSAIN